MSSIAVIRARAEARKGGASALAALLPPAASPGASEDALRVVADDRVLSEMTKRIFSAGFVWRVIETKWPGFEDAFLGFDPPRLIFEPDEFWERLIKDTRIVRNAQKIMAVRANARFVQDIAAEHGGFGRFLAGWPAADLIGLLDVLARRGTRLGGMTGQYFLRFAGKDSFILNSDVVACLRDSGLDISATPGSKRDLRLIQERFNAWALETGLPLAHLSRICALSIGENRSAQDMDDDH